MTLVIKHNQPKPPTTSQNNSQSAKTTQNYPKQPKPAELSNNHPNKPNKGTTTQNYSQPPKTSHKHPQ